ncbi:hypothetical protein P8452_59109 [Trifolium repens]|nr:hypothetical protein P8452_59109 [Trifolium repens]
MDHQHSLQLKPAGAPHTCSGCGELGFGSSYHCENFNCNYILHEECAYPEPYAFHPFFEKSYFEFHKKPPGHRTRYCDACGKDVLGFVYHCSSTKLDLHPCCLKLKHSISDESGNVNLELSHKDLILENWRRGYFSQGDREAQLALTRSRRGRTMSTYTKIAIVVFKLIFSAIFGNPISAIAAIVEALASN